MPNMTPGQSNFIIDLRNRIPRTHRVIAYVSGDYRKIIFVTDNEEEFRLKLAFESNRRGSC